MAAEEFDLAGIQALKLNAYKKEYFKPMIVSKASFVMLFHRLDLVGAKKSFIAIFFKKESDAQVAFKTVKKGKLHLMKRTALATVKVAKGEKGEDTVTLEVKKGALAPDVIMSEGQALFTSIKMGLKVVGASESGSEDVDKGTKKEEKLDKKEEKLDKKEEKRDERVAKRKKIRENIAKMKVAEGKATKKQLLTLVDKYEGILETLTIEAKASEDGIDETEQKEIDELTTSLNELKATVAKREDKKTRKLTTKERETIVSNMDKMDQKLQQILAKLG